LSVTFAEQKVKTEASAQRGKAPGRSEKTRGESGAVRTNVVGQKSRLLQPNGGRKRKRTKDQTSVRTGGSPWKRLGIVTSGGRAKETKIEGQARAQRARSSKKRAQLRGGEEGSHRGAKRKKPHQAQQILTSEIFRHEPAGAQRKEAKAQRGRIGGEGGCRASLNLPGTRGGAAGPPCREIGKEKGFSSQKYHTSGGKAKSQKANPAMFSDLEKGGESNPGKKVEGDRGGGFLPKAENTKPG